ncbi:hypothetical protein [Muricomes intestini]|jgi:hypothetical protein|uniref:hypothetical protein n=2 Tax=Muricomes intestini TaxID=1796634 RepID=UPI002FDDA726
MNRVETKTCKKRILSAILVLVVLCVLFLSNIYIGGHIRHDCTGDGCPICAEIHHAQNLINQLGGALVLTVVVLGTVYIVEAVLSIIYSLIQRETLISNKVRLND